MRNQRYSFELSPIVGMLRSADLVEVAQDLSGGGERRATMAQVASYVASTLDATTGNGYGTRAEFVALVAESIEIAAGLVVTAGGLQYRAEAGATVIGDLPGYVPLNPTLRHWGCAGDGVTDDTALIDEALAAGLPLDGESLTYAVTGVIDLPANTTLRDATFKQLAPAASSAVITLRATDVDRLTLERVKVDRNGDGSNGGLATAPNGLQASCIGILIDGGQYHSLVDLEVFGDDSGTGIRFASLDSTSTVIRPYAHDMMCEVPGASDDCVQGIVFQLCIGLTIEFARAARLSWRPDPGTDATYENSRAVAFSGCEYCQVIGTSTEDSGQGQDVTGNLGNGNRYNRFIGGTFRRCATWGNKFANLARGNVIIGAVAEACISAGFVDSSSFDDEVDDGDANRVVQCRAVDCGKTGGSSAAFLKLNGSRTYTNLVHFDRCVAVDRRTPAEMVFGFRCEPSPRARATARAINCISVGHTDTAKSGFTDDLFNKTNVSSQGAAGAATYITGSALVLPPPATFGQGGLYTCTAYLTKTAAGTGSPTVQLRFGAASTAATLLGECTLSAQTAATDRAELVVKALFRETGANTVITAWCTLISNSGTAGFATRSVQVQAIGVAAFDSLVDGAYFGVSINPEAGATWTVIGAHARLELAGTGT